MPRNNLAVSPLPAVEGTAILVGLLCTLPITVGIQPKSTAVCEEKNGTQMSTCEECFPASLAMLNAITNKQDGRPKVYKHADKQEANEFRKMIMQLSPKVAQEIRRLESWGVPYYLMFTSEANLVDCREDGALDVWDTEGLVKGSAVYRRALENRAHLKEIEEVSSDQVAAIKNILTTVGNLARPYPNTPVKKEALQFKYFLTDVCELLSSLKRTNAPKALLPCAVTSMFAKYKKKYWDNGVMKLAGKEAAEELEASAAVLLDERYVADYLKFIESAELTPPGPSHKAFDAAVDVLSVVDKNLTGVFRNLIVGLHDTVKPQVESLLNRLSSTVVEGTEASNGQDTGDDVALRKVQIHQVKICIRNYLQCLYNIAQDIAPIYRKSDPDMKAQLQAVMHNRISDVNGKFWPVLESCLEQLCDAKVVEDIKHKYNVLTKQLTDKSQQPVRDSSKGFWSWMMNCVKTPFTSKDKVNGVEGKSAKDEEITKSPILSDLIQIVENLGFYKQIASSSPEGSPIVPDTIDCDDRISICAALGFVNKSKAAALFTFLKRLQEYLDRADYKAISKREELPFVEKFCRVDWHILAALQGKKEFSYVYDQMDTGACEKIMTSVFRKYFDECWSHVAAVLEGGGQEDVVEKFKAMAIDILEWKQPPDLKQKLSQIIQNLKGVVDINVAWFLAGMATFVQGAPSRTWELKTLTQEMWTDALCPKFKPGHNIMYQPPNAKLTLCLPSGSRTNPFELMDLAEVTLGPYGAYRKNLEQCGTQPMESNGSHHRNVIYYAPDGNATTIKNEDGSRDILATAATMGINTSCASAFEARWYDAYEEAIPAFCKTMFYASGIPSRWSMTYEEFEMEVLNKTFEPLWTDVLTGSPGITLENDKVNKGYQGFVVCKKADSWRWSAALGRLIDTSLSWERATAKIKDWKSNVLDAMLIQRLCKYKNYNGKARDADIHSSKLSSDSEGKLFIENPDHRGLIGDCRSTLREAYQYFIEGDPLEDERTELEGVGNKRNQTTPLTRKELAEVILEAERDEMRYHQELMHNATYDKNGTAWQTLQRDLTGEIYGGRTGSAREQWTALSQYWPIVCSALGGVAIFAAGKVVWDRCKVRPSAGYRSFRAAGAGEEAESVV